LGCDLFGLGFSKYGVGVGHGVEQREREREEEREKQRKRERQTEIERKREREREDRYKAKEGRVTAGGKRTSLGSWSSNVLPRGCMPRPSEEGTTCDSYRRAKA